MPIQLGDKVKFINESLEGIVTSIKANGLVGVTVEDDFELDVMARELVVTEPVVKPSGSEQAIPDTPIENHSGIPVGLYWVVKPLQNGAELLILNRFEYAFQFTLYKETTTAIELIQQGALEPGKYRTVAKFNSPSPQKWGIFHLWALGTRQFPAKVPVPLGFKANFTQLPITNYNHQIRGEEVFLSPMDPVTVDTWSGNAAATAEKSIPQPTEKAPAHTWKQVGKPSDELDLHASALGIADWEPDAIVQKQMEVFRNTLDLAIAYKMPTLTVIHGVGSGVLKNLILLSINGHKGVKDWKQADPKTFGEGATLLFLRQ